DFVKKHEQPVFLRPKADEKWPEHGRFQNVRAAGFLCQPRHGCVVALLLRNTFQVQYGKLDVDRRTDVLNGFTTRYREHRTQAVMPRSQQGEGLTQRFNIERSLQA